MAWPFESFQMIESKKLHLSLSVTECVERWYLGVEFYTGVGDGIYLVFSLLIKFFIEHKFVLEILSENLQI